MSFCLVSAPKKLTVLGGSPALASPHLLRCGLLRSLFPGPCAPGEAGGGPEARLLGGRVAGLHPWIGLHGPLLAQA